MRRVSYASFYFGFTVSTQFRKRIFLCFVILAIALAALYALDVFRLSNASGPSSAKATLLPKVIVKEAASTEVAQSVLFTSTIQAKRSLELYAQVEEKITQLNFKDQQQV